MEEEVKQQLREIIAESEPRIKSSSIFMGLFSGSYRKDPVPLLQLALAIVMDKPVGLIVLEEETVPEHLKKIAFHIEYVKDLSEMEGATKRLLEKACVIVEKT